MTLDEPYRIPTPRRILLEQLLWTLAPLCRRGQVGGGPCNGEGPILEQIYCENMRGWAPAVTHIHPVRFLLQTHWVAVLEPVSCEPQWTALAPIGKTIAIVTVKFDDPSRPFREKYLELGTVKLGDPSRSFREDHLESVYCEIMFNMTVDLSQVRTALERGWAPTRDIPFRNVWRWATDGGNAPRTVIQCPAGNKNKNK